jgi:hypothetical protein
VAQNRRQIRFLAHGPMSVGSIGRLYGQGLVPPG